MSGGFVFDFGTDDQPAQAEEEVGDESKPACKQWKLSGSDLERTLTEMHEEEQKTMPVGDLRVITLQPTLLSKDQCPFSNELKSSDIIQGVYEGGFKLWSCAEDLGKYLADENINFSNKKVLEAGCGHGVPAMTALFKGASSVVFQDYNEEVLKLLTIPNIIANAESKARRSVDATAFVEDTVAKTQFWAGDWGDLLPKEGVSGDANQYDVILSTDTLYTVRTARSLFRFIRSHLAFPDGIAYIGSKTMYFGCGGGVSELEGLVASDGDAGAKKMCLKLVKNLADGLDNDRQIVSLTWA